MEPVSVVDFGSYLPERKVDIDFFFGEIGGDPLASSPLLRAPKERHHVERDERAAEMIEKAARPMFERLGIEPEGNVDLLISNVLLPDFPITGHGAEAAHRLGVNPEWIIDLHNSGCGSFGYMLKIARQLIGSGAAEGALLCTVQNGAGRLCALPGARTKPQSAVPGDGCGVAYVRRGEESPVLAVETRNDPASAQDMYIGSPDGRKYWEPGESELSIEFNAENLKDILARGNSLVPEVVTAVCEQIEAQPTDIDVLVTNQPNRVYLRNWREAIGLEPDRHLDTFDRYGNLLCAGVPVTLDHAIRAGDVKDGDLVVVAGFAHAGDFASAAAFRWHANGSNGSNGSAEQATGAEPAQASSASS